jgi:hypothetical protein
MFRTYLVGYTFFLSVAFALWMVLWFVFADSVSAHLLVVLFWGSTAAWPFALRRHYRQSMENV